MPLQMYGRLLEVAEQEKRSAALELEKSAADNPSATTSVDFFGTDWHQKTRISIKDSFTHKGSSRFCFSIEVKCQNKPCRPMVDFLMLMN